MPLAPIAVKACCVFRDGERIFAIRCYDPGDDTTFYKPPGGSVEFGEHSRDAASREVREELGAEVVDLRFLGHLEFFAAFNRVSFHEIALVYEARFAEERFYTPDSMEIEDHSWTGVGMDRLTALWMPLGVFRSGAEDLGPAGLLDLLDHAP
jgi:8-oxo-dGTP pyrophosphatase MutT (NUDIX family)